LYSPATTATPQLGTCSRLPIQSSANHLKCHGCSKPLSLWAAPIEGAGGLTPVASLRITAVGLTYNEHWLGHCVCVRRPWRMHPGSLVCQQKEPQTPCLMIAQLTILPAVGTTEMYNASNQIQCWPMPDHHCHTTQ
jgi:hypothetical protein